MQVQKVKREKQAVEEIPPPHLAAIERGLEEVRQGKGRPIEEFLREWEDEERP